jgi:PKD repeat protein
VGIRGIFRYTSTDFASMHSAGFNAATDGGVQDNGSAESASGITGMVWVDAYDNTTCVQKLSNSAIAAMVQANVSVGQRGLRYQIGDEPTANGCGAAPAYAAITQAVHSADPTAKTWVADDQFQVGNPLMQGVPMKGSVDILAFDIYPCQSGPCDYAAIDSAVQQIHAAQVTNWEFIIQDFSAFTWRWPTPSEIQTQFDHWKNQGASGYWVFAWDYLGAQEISQPGNVAALQQINSQAFGSGPSPSPAPAPSPSASPAPSPSPSRSPISVSASATPTSGTTPVSVRFTSTAGGGSTPYRYSWTFGDGAGSTSQNPAHTYLAPGSYSAVVTVTDASGARATASPAAVSVAPGPLAASATVSPTAGDAPVVASLTGWASGGTPPYTYVWDLADGASSPQSSVGHTYSSPGTYAAVVTATDSRGQIARAVAVLKVYSALSASVSTSPTSGAAPLSVGFKASSSGGLPAYGYYWDFGDGSTGTGSTVTHVFGAGSFRATLTVVDAAGGTWTGNADTVVVSGSVAPPATTPASPKGGAGAGSAPQTASTPSSGVRSTKKPAQTSPASAASSAASSARGSGGGDNPLMNLALFLSVFSTGLGGYLFVGWRHGRAG